MEVLWLLIPLSLLLVFLIGTIFWWSLRSGQFDDLEGPGYQVLMDDDRVTSEKPEIRADSNAAQHKLVDQYQQDRQHDR